MSYKRLSLTRGGIASLAHRRGAQAATGGAWAWARSRCSRCSRCSSMAAITAGSVITASTRSAPARRWHTLTWMSNTRRSRCIQVMATREGMEEDSPSPVVALGRGAGTSRRRWRAWGANTPWYRIRWQQHARRLIPRLTRRIPGTPTARRPTTVPAFGRKPRLWASNAPLDAVQPRSCLPRNTSRIRVLHHLAVSAGTKQCSCDIDRAIG